MQAPTRIGVAGCVLVAGAVTAGMFRKTAEDVPPADRSEGGVTLRQPDPTPLLAAGGWRGKATDAAGTVNEQRRPDDKPAEGRPTAPPLPRLTLRDGMAPAVGSDAGSSVAGPLKGPIDLPADRAAAPLARVVTPEPDDDWQLHEVVDGDTLGSLALRYFGDAGLADDLRRANPALVTNADILPVGAFLKIPSRRSIEASATGEATERTGNAHPGAGWRKAASQRP